jgi:hypothetical protein
MQTTEQFLITQQSTELLTEFQITLQTTELLAEFRVIRNCSVVCMGIGNSMHSSFVVIWNSANNSVVCRVIRNYSVVCRVIAKTIPNYLAKYQAIGRIPNYPANYRTIPNYPEKYRTIPNCPTKSRTSGRIPNYHKRTMHRNRNYRSLHGNW